jgi:hypothetical protein
VIDLRPPDVMLFQGRPLGGIEDAPGARLDSAQRGQRGLCNNMYGGGGGGGANGFDGAIGGKGRNAANTVVAGGAQGLGAAGMLTPLLGGARGGIGGCDTTGLDINGGAGGGAIQIVSRGTLTVGATGVINAGGGGGKSIDQAYAGGGSGGVILLQAAQLQSVLGSAVVANGGGGAGASCPGEAGLASGDPAQGGPRVAGNETGGNGGAAMPARAGQDASVASRGGGGGGGGAGLLFIQTADGMPSLAGTQSPDPSVAIVSVR